MAVQIHSTNPRNSQDAISVDPLRRDDPEHHHSISVSPSSASSSEIRTSTDNDFEKHSRPICEDSEIQKMFQKYDANGDGRISSEELRDSLRALDFNPSPPDLLQAMTEMDKDGDGYIDLDEFTEFHSRSVTEASPELREAFKVYDKDNNGLISPKELHDVMRKLGEKATLKDCGRMIDSVDLDGDGCVNFEEFIAMMSKKC